MKQTIKMYVKAVQNQKFNVGSTKLKDGWVNVKFGKQANIDINKLAIGYHDVTFDTAEASFQVQNYDKADGTTGTDTTLWINDEKTIIVIHERTAEEQAQVDSMFN